MSQHVDLFKIDWFNMKMHFVRTMTLEELDEHRQLKAGWSTYFSVSDPHEDEECTYARS